MCALKKIHPSGINCACHSKTCSILYCLPYSSRLYRRTYHLFRVSLWEYIWWSALCSDGHSACFWCSAFITWMQGRATPVSPVPGTNILTELILRTLGSWGGGHFTVTKIAKLLFQVFRWVCTPITGQEELLFFHFLCRFGGTQLLQFF